MLAHLPTNEALLVVDNCEHVIDEAAAIAAAILTAVHAGFGFWPPPTSARVAGETSVSGFRCCRFRRPVAKADARCSVAVRRHRAIRQLAPQSSTRDFTLTDENAPIVADICRRLDGIPLAIELAAARVKVLSVPTLAQRLNERFRILTGGSRDALPRQKTLGA